MHWWCVTGAAGRSSIQVRWLAATVAAAGGVAFAVAFLLPAGTPGSDIATAIGLSFLCLLPVSIAVAVLRYRLYDLDRIVSRTIGYGLVTAVVVTAFWGLVLVLQPLVAQVTGGQTLAVAASTLVVASAFTPLRRRSGRRRSPASTGPRSTPSTRHPCSPGRSGTRRSSMTSGRCWSTS